MTARMKAHIPALEAVQGGRTVLVWDDSDEAAEEALAELISSGVVSDADAVVCVIGWGLGEPPLDPDATRH